MSPANSYYTLGVALFAATGTFLFVRRIRGGNMCFSIPNLERFDRTWLTLGGLPRDSTQALLPPVSLHPAQSNGAICIMQLNED